jgi:hypothetical protein
MVETEVELKSPLIPLFQKGEVTKTKLERENFSIPPFERPTAFSVPLFEKEGLGEILE